MTSDYDYKREEDKKWVRETVEGASGSRYCSNCFMALGLKSMAGATVKVGDKEFCDQACYSEYMENYDDDERPVSF